MIRGAVFPHSRGGVVVGGDDRPRPRHRRDHRGRAARSGARSTSARTSSGPATRWPAIIANQFGEATGIQRAALIGMGVVLLVLTVGVGDPRPRHRGPLRPHGRERSHDRRRAAALTLAARSRRSRAQGRRTSSRTVLIVARVPRSRWCRSCSSSSTWCSRASKVISWDFLTERPAVRRPPARRRHGPGGRRHAAHHRRRRR